MSNNLTKEAFDMVDFTKAEGFIKVLENHSALIRKVCRAYAFTKEDREDLYQDIVVQLWRSFDNYDPSYRYSTWIYRIALNVAISRLRKLKKREDWKSIETFATNDREGGDSKELIDQLYALIREMRPLDRALMLLYLEDNSHAEIGEILGISKSNVGTKINRLKKLLQKKFNQKK